MRRGEPRMKKSRTKNGVNSPSVEPQPFEYAMGAAGRPISLVTSDCTCAKFQRPRSRMYTFESNAPGSTCWIGLGVEKCGNKMAR